MAIFIAPTASVMGRVTIGNDVSIWYGAVIRGDVEEIHLGDGCNIQDNAVLHADEGDKTIIGARVTVGHSAIVHGAEIGEGSIVGAGAVVNRDVPAFALMLGVPARHAGWMSRFGERLPLATQGGGEATCPHTGDRYLLRHGVLQLETRKD